MQLNVRQSVRAVIASVLAMLFLVPADLVAQDHVVSPTELQKEVVAASQSRQHNLDTLQQFLSTPAAEKAIKSAQMDPRQVKTAVSALDDQDLAQLAARALFTLAGRKSRTVSCALARSERRGSAGLIA